MKRLAILALAVAIAPLADARSHGIPRDRSVSKAFQRVHPCPSTGLYTGRCPGYVRDHVVSLCKGGPDSPSNMQWQTTADSRAKDRWECKP